MMKKTWLTAALTLSLCSITYGTHAKNLTLVTESFAYHNYEDSSGNITGSSTEVLKRALDDAGLSANFSLYPWARSYNLALKAENTCVYSTTVTEQRKPLFKWVAPVTHSGWNVYAASDRASEFAMTSLDDMKTNGWVVGVLNEAARHQHLKGLGGFTMDVATSNDINGKKLADGRIDLWFVSPEVVSAYQKENPDFKATVVFEERKTNLGLACNKSVDDNTIAKLQSALEKLIASGERDKIIADEKAKYLN